jgi:hypothetical protein
VHKKRRLDGMLRPRARGREGKKRQQEEDVTAGEEEARPEAASRQRTSRRTLKDQIPKKQQPRLVVMHLEVEAEAEVKGKPPVAGSESCFSFLFDLHGALDGNAVD